MSVHPEIDAEQDIDVDVDPEENEAVAVVTTREKITIDQLFRDGELRLWEDPAGWSGYIRERNDDGEIEYYYVNTHHSDDSWLRKQPVTGNAVREGVKKHIEDSAAGSAGRFVRRCLPP